MANCTTTLKLGENEFLFKSESDLNRFLYNNRHRLRLNTDNVMYSMEMNPQEEKMALLKKISKRATRKNKVASSKDIFSSGEKNEGGNKNTITGTSVHKLRLNDGRPLVTPMTHDDFRKIEQPKLVESGRFTESEAENFISNLFVEWEKSAELGINVHKIPELVFSSSFTDPVLILNEFKKQVADAKMNDSTILGLIKSFKDLKENYLEKIHPGGKYLTELEVESIGMGGNLVKGIIDLVVIDQKGVPHIYDFKTSTKNIKDFSSAKTQTYKYQLALYRQLLGKLGFDVKNSKLGIIPVELDIDYNADLINSAKIDVNDIDILTDSIHDHLQYGRGYIWKKMNLVLPVPLPSFSIGSDYVTETTDLIHDVLGYEPRLGVTVRDVNKWISNNVKNRNGKRQYFDKLTGSWVDYNENNGVEQVSNHMRELNESNLTAASNFADKLAPYLDGTRKILQSNTKGKKTFDQANFSEYHESGWSINKDFEHLGILLLYNEAEQVFDVISVTVNHLQEDLKLSYGSSVLGNFISDSRLNDDKILKANVGNVELLRSMFLINEAISKGELFNGYKVGTFKVVNHKGSMSFFQNQELLYNSFNRLINQYNKKNGKNIKNVFQGTLETESFEDRIKRTFQNIIDSGSGFHNDLTILNSFANNKTNNIVDRLIQLQEEIEAYGANPMTTDFNTDVPKLSAIVAEAINHYRGINYEYSIKDVAKTAFPTRGTATSLVTTAADRVTNEFEKEIMIPFRQKLIHEVNKLGERNRTAFESLRKEGFKWGTSVNLFDNCIETDGNNFHDSFKVKNPYDSNNNLTNAERSYLKFFLLELNQLRHADITSENCEAAMELRSSGEWFNIPLMRGELINRITKNGTVGEYIKDQMDEVTNINSQLSQEMINKEREQHEQFKEWINSMDLEGDKRKSLIAKNGIGYYSRDLSNVLLVYGMKKMQQNSMNKVLPFVRANLIFNNGFYGITNIQAKELQDYLLKYFQTAAYEKMHIPENLKNTAAVVQGVSGILAKAALSFNMLSITRETIQGVYNNFLRAGVQHAAIEMPSMKQLAASYAEVSVKMLKDVRHNNKLNGLAMQFHGILGGSLKTLAGDVGANANTIGGKAFHGDIMFKLNQAPDFLHRISLLIAFMKKDGSYDSYKWDNETLIYDWKTDKRFSIYAKYSKNEKSIPESMKDAYNKQKGMYSYMIRTFAEEGYRNSETNRLLTMGDDLPMAYTSKQMATFKDIIDQTHGHMSGYTKTQLERGLYGSMYMMFKSYIKSKVNTYTMKGGYYVQGEVKPFVDPDTGEQMYRHQVLNDKGEVVREYVDKNPDNGTMEYQFIESYQEGIGASLKRMYEMFKENSWEGAKNAMKDDAIRRNMKYLSADLFTGLCLFLLYQLCFDWEELEKEHGYTLTKMLQSPFLSPMDNNPIQLASTLLGSAEPPAIAMGSSWFKSIINISAIGDNYSHNVAKNIALYRIGYDAFVNEK